MCLAFQTVGNSEHWEETIRNNGQHSVRKKFNLILKTSQLILSQFIIRINCMHHMLSSGQQWVWMENTEDPWLIFDKKKDLVLF